MSGLSILAVFGGAGCGALLRWGLGGWRNPVFPTLPLGTLVANLVGGLLVGSGRRPSSATRGVWRRSSGLLVITGFLGGLTTFSTLGLGRCADRPTANTDGPRGRRALHLLGAR